jgi:hypothetical protein
MSKAVKIFGVTAVLAALGFAAYKGTSFLNKVKQASGNINFAVSFSRIHGLIGEGLTKLISPTIRVLFNLNLKNFSGFSVDVKNIYARIETQKDTDKSWSAIATTSSYFNITTNDGTEINKTLTFDFKGIPTITSLISKGNRHRIVMTYNFKGQQLQFIEDIDISGPINSYWAAIKNQFNSFKGVESKNSLALAS